MQTTEVSDSALETPEPVPVPVPVPEPEAPVSILDEIIEFKDDAIASEGLHAGVIIDVINVIKADKITKKPHPWLGIVVALDECDEYGEPFKVKVEMTKTPKALNSHIRNILVRLGFKPAKDGKFTLRNLVGTAVDVFVTHKSGGNKNYKFAHVEPDDLDARGKGVVKPANEIDDIVVESKWAKRRERWGRAQ